MNRRTLLSVVGAGCVALSGCLGDSNDGVGANGRGGNGSGAGSEDEAAQYRAGYELLVLENRESVHPNLVDCRYDDFPADIQDEVTQAIETGSYVSDERPKLVQMDCYGYDMYVEYEGEYYKIVEGVASAERD